MVRHDKLLKDMDFCEQAMRAAVLAIFCFLTGVSGAAFAAAPLSGTCDPDFMDVMETRSWLQGKQDMEVAEKLILKPDSVLEYSCFTTLSKRAGAFTDSRFAPASDSIDALATTPANNFVSGNFSHTLGGGSATGSPADVCGAMYAVWDLLKCYNFDQADFQTFEEFANSDRRTLPAVCNDPGRGSAISLASAAANTTPAAPPVSGGVESVATFRDLLDPARCLAINPVATGAIFKNADGVDVVEAVCPAPGCYYDGVSGCK